MAKNRTRKQKENAIHPFTISWDESPKTTTKTPSVNREKSSAGLTQAQNISFEESTNKSAFDGNLGTIKHDLLKSLITAAFIMCLLVVLYFSL